MKKFLIATVMLLGSISLANAERFSLGVSVLGGEFSVDGASETFSGNHSSNTTSTKVVKKSSAEKEDATGAFYLGSVFAEFDVNDNFSIGASYVPSSADSEETENVQIDTGATKSNSDDTSRTNKVKVSFEDLTTVYALAKLNENVYAKVGYVQVELITKEDLATGGAYGDDTLEGYTIALGYNHDLAGGMLVRGEVAHIEIDGTTLKNTNDTNKSVTADGITGMGAAISVGKSF